jgi:hypothetical protein
MTKKKEESIKLVIIQCLWYWATIIVISLSAISWEVIVFGSVVALTHTIIDLNKYFYVVKLKKKNKMTMFKERNIFFLEQLLHFICLVLIAYLFVMKGNVLNFSSNVTQFFYTVKISEITFASWILVLLIIYRPANIAISKLLMMYKPPESKDEDSTKDNNAGRFIGTVERIILIIFISMKQYSAIGLVLTAKSIARYDRISKEKDFAEYYLLGTLISTLVVIVVSFIL